MPTIRFLRSETTASSAFTVPAETICFLQAEEDDVSQLEAKPKGAELTTVGACVELDRVFAQIVNSAGEASNVWHRFEVVSLAD